MKRPTIQVVSGVAFRDGRILLQQRTARRDFPFTWECPGGKVEEGEQPIQAIAREWTEELDVLISIVNLRPIWYGVFETENGRIGISFFHVEMHGDPDPQEGQDFGWFSLTEMRALGRSITPGNYRAREAIYRLWNRVRKQEEKR
jgi:8-oxo-dGTP diphosphatase